MLLRLWMLVLVLVLLLLMLLMVLLVVVPLTLRFVSCFQRVQEFRFEAS